MNKIFCIGFQKTGTSSIGRALELLGFRMCGFSPELLEGLENNDLKAVYEKIDKYDVFQDNPWPILFKELDKKYPGSKFILTVRDSKKWIISSKKHFKQKKTRMNDWVYSGKSCVEGNEEFHIKVYEEHNKKVTEYFKDRPDDLLIMDIEKGDGWGKLCGFIGKKTPLGPFPHVNRTNFISQTKIYRKIKENVKKIISRELYMGALRILMRVKK